MSTKKPLKPHIKFLLCLLGVAILGSVSYAIWRQTSRPQSQEEGRTALYYQDSMHPWIKSEQPGKCTVCNMALTPIYQGQPGFNVSDDLVVLRSNSVTVLNVQTEEIRRQPLFRSLRVAGTLEANEGARAIVSAPAPALVETLSVSYTGAEVEKGQILATLFSPDLSQKSRYLRAATTVSNTMAQTSGRSDFFSAQLLAPFTGTVVERAVVPGQYVAEGEKLLTIVDASVLWFRFDVYERQLPWFQNGQHIAVQVPAVPGTVFPAVISFIEPTLNEATRTVKVRADIRNPLVSTAQGAPQRLLRFGMYAEAVVRAEVQNVLTIPRAAVLLPGEVAYAYLDQGDGAYERRRIRLGRQGDEVWEVLSGLEEGDRVVTSGNVLIDSQAQLNRGESHWNNESMPSKEDKALPAVAALGEQGSRRITGAQERALSNFLAVANGISQALAADKLEDLKPHLSKLREVIPPLVSELGGVEPWGSMLQRIRETATWPAPADLDQARQSFLPFSTNVVALVQVLRAEESAFASLKVYHCPMAPKPGLWFQAKGPLRNPYYGAEMLTCGSEVKPAKPNLPVSQPSVLDPMIVTQPISNAPAMSNREATLQHASTSSHEPAATEAHSASQPVSKTKTRSRADTLYGNMATVEEMRARRWATIAAAHSHSRTASNSLPAFQSSTAKAESSTATLMPHERQVIEEFITAADHLGLALASDDLHKFNFLASQLPGLATALTLEFRAQHRWGQLVDRIVATTTHPPAKNLKEARTYFLRFSTATVEWIKRVRSEEQTFRTIKIYHSNEAPAPGQWLQTKTPVRNPFCGAAMLESGKEVEL